MARSPNTGIGDKFSFCGSSLFVSDPNYATSTFFDEQLTALASVYHPERLCYSFVSLLDCCGLVRGAHVVSELFKTHSNTPTTHLNTYINVIEY